MLHAPPPPQPPPQHPSRKQRSSWTNNVSIFVWSWRHLSFTFPGAHGLPPPTSQLQASPPQGSQGLSPTFTTCATTCVRADLSSLAHPSSSLSPSHHTAAGRSSGTESLDPQAFTGRCKGPASEQYLGKSWPLLPAGPLPQTALTAWLSPRGPISKRRKSRSETLHNLS